MTNLPKLHLVAGFLGSGKTTAIIQACKLYLQRGLRVGVVTNDQGKYLVDTAFFRLDALPAVEVGGGCFCCNYKDFQSQLEKLLEEAKPEVIFAESVGSCADLVATVIKPFLTLTSSKIKPSSFSVFADARLLRLRLRGQPLPFSADVQYLFDQQIAEGSLLVVNKIDLIPEGERIFLKEGALERYPGKSVLLQNSLRSSDVATWLTFLEAPPTHSSLDALPSLDMDYQRYGEAESRLAWLDAELVIRSPEDVSGAMTPTQTVRQVLRALGEAIKGSGAPIGHLKFVVADREEKGVKVSLTTFSDPEWLNQLPEIEADPVRVLVNARLEMDADRLRKLVEEALDRSISETGARLLHKKLEAFHPALPHPRYRMP